MTPSEIAHMLGTLAVLLGAGWKLSAVMARMETCISKLGGDVAEIKTVLGKSADRQGEMLERLVAVETKVNQ